MSVPVNTNANLKAKRIATIVTIISFFVYVPVSALIITYFVF